MADHTQLQIPEQGDLYAADATSQRSSEGTFSDDVSNDFYTQFNDLSPAGPPLPTPLVAYGTDDLAPAPLPSPVVTYTFDNAVISPRASWMLPSYDVHYAVNNEPLPTAASLLPAKTSLIHPQYTLNSAPSNYEYYGYTQATEAAPFGAQFDLSQPDSWATPDMSVGVYPQVSYPRTVGVDQGYYQSYSYTTTTYPATAESTFGMQGFYA